MKTQTKVLFLIDRTDSGTNTQVFAYFPEMVHNGNIMTCYSHIGQHSSCHIDYANECKEAKTNDYLDLLGELIGQGYNDLVIMNKQTIQCHRPPTKWENKFGEGATHYRDFPLSVIGLKKGKAMWKDWFIAPDDKLRYYTS